VDRTRRKADALKEEQKLRWPQNTQAAYTLRDIKEAWNNWKEKRSSQNQQKTQ
jgi:hypothetical protein